MTRVKGGAVAKNRRRKVLKNAKGYFGSKHRLYKTAQEQLFHSGAYAYRDRKQNKRNFRKLWITRINAACRMNDISYSKFINGLSKAGVEINRKMLSEVAIDNPKLFASYVTIAKDALAGKNVKSVAEKANKEVAASPKEDTADNSTLTSYNNRKLGDATGELGPFYFYTDKDNNKRHRNNWYSDSSVFVASFVPWFLRGGNHDASALAGQFNFDRGTGGVYTSDGFRLVLTPQTKN